ncbi:MAG TPA: hypothetical protein VI522_01835, partial [Gammaproteobacteria bacterium]|nr:hypothetical protein [Gammaproteobacteria bacterium]
MSHLAVGINIAYTSVLKDSTGGASSLIKENLINLQGNLLDFLREPMGFYFSSLIRPTALALTRLMYYKPHLHKEKALCWAEEYNADTQWLLEEYAENAAELQIESMDKIMTEWISTYNITLEKTRVLIVVAHGPRDNLIEGEYYKYLFKKFKIASPESYIYKIEMLPDQMATIDVEKDLIHDFLSGQQLNAEIASTMLGDKEAMRKDVLAKYAPSILEKLPPHVITEEGSKPRCPFRG